MTDPRSLDDLELRIRDRLQARQAELVTHLEEMVAIPSGQGHVPGLDQMRDLMVGRLEALGATSELMDGDPRPPWLLGGSDAPPPPPVVGGRCRRPRLQGQSDPAPLADLGDAQTAESAVHSVTVRQCCKGIRLREGVRLREAVSCEQSSCHSRCWRILFGTWSHAQTLQVC